MKERASRGGRCLDSGDRVSTPKTGGRHGILYYPWVPRVRLIYVLVCVSSLVLTLDAGQRMQARGLGGLLRRLEQTRGPGDRKSTSEEFCSKNFYFFLCPNVCLFVRLYVSTFVTFSFYSRKSNYIIHCSSSLPVS